MKILATLLLASAVLSAADADKAVLAAANDLSNAQMSKDKATLEKLLGDELVYSHSSGMRETKAQHIEAIMKPTSHYEKIELSDQKIMSYGNTAVLICKAIFSTNNNGKKADNNLSMMQTWVKRGTGWQLVARWTTKLTP
jgi:ketosteroid isomerase-like protein